LINASNNLLGDARMAQRILRLPLVKDITGLPRSTIYFKISKNEFPSPINLGKRSVGWLESDIHDWVQQQIANTTKPKT
jgi:prophage regulatory protein